MKKDLPNFFEKVSKDKGLFLYLLSYVLDFYQYRDISLSEMIWTGSIVRRIEVSEIENVQR